MKCYSINELSKISGIGYATLSLWAKKKWLLPSAKVGSRFKYNKEAFRKAAACSLNQGKVIPPALVKPRKAVDFIKTLKIA